MCAVWLHFLFTTATNDPFTKGSRRPNFLISVIRRRSELPEGRFLVVIIISVSAYYYSVNISCAKSEHFRLGRYPVENFLFQGVRRREEFRLVIAGAEYAESVLITSDSIIVSEDRL
jgi:hypothetical protein